MKWKDPFYSRPSIHDTFNILTGEQESFDFSDPRICHGKGSGGGTNTTTSTTTPPPEVMAAYQQALAGANTASSAPLQQYQGSTVAGFTPDQLQAFGTINQAQGTAQPFIQGAANLINQGTQPLWSGVQQFSPDAVKQYQSPYTQQVLDAQTALEQNQDAQQQSALKGNAISAGAWGGDRAGVASAILSGQQALANNSTNANILNTGYNNALGEFNTQQQAQLGANEANSYLNQQGAFGLANLGSEALGTQLQGASSQLQAGALQQQLNQENLNVPYQQFLQQQAYPFQTAQYYANIAEGLGSNSGGTSSTTAPQTSSTSQNVGLGLGGLGLLGSAFFGQGGRAYRRGGSVPRFASGGMSSDIASGIPDLSVSFVPVTSAGGGGGRGDGLPPPPRSQDPNQGQSGMPSTSSILSAGKGLKGLLGMFDKSGDPNAGDGGYGGFDVGDWTDEGSDAGAGASGEGLGSGSDFLGDMFSDWKRGGRIPARGALGARRLATGGTSSPLTALGMGSGSGNGPSQSKVDHDNKWMSQVGDIVGTVFGSMFGGPVGGYIGGKAGADGGGTLGDLFGGNWDSLWSDLRAGPAGAIYPNDSASGEGNSPQLGGNFSGTTVLSAYGDGNAGLGSTGGSAGKAGAGFGLSQLASFLKKGGVARGYDDGGDVGGQTPIDARESIPQDPAKDSNLNDMTPEQLQQYVMRTPIGSDKQKAAAAVLQQKRMMPNSGTPVQGGFGSQAQAVMARGGRSHFADGGDTDDGIDIPFPPPPDQLQREADLQGDLVDQDTPPVPASQLQPTGAFGQMPAAPQPSSAAPQRAAPQRAPVSDELPHVEHAEVDPWMALAQAGFAAAAGRSPSALQNFGEGALAGLSNYAQQKKEAYSVNQAADKLLQEAKQHKEQLALDQQKVDQQGHYQTDLIDLKRKQAEVTAQQKQAGMLAPEDLDFMADRFLAGDKSAVAGLGSGNVGAINRASLQAAIHQRASDLGMTPKQVANELAEYQGQVSEQRQIGSRIGAVRVGAEAVKGAADLALASSDKVDRTQYPDLNKIDLDIARRSGDNNVVDFMMKNNTLINEFAAARNPRGIPRLADKDEAREILSTAYNKGQYETGVNAIRQEIANIQGATRTVREGKDSPNISASDANKETHSIPPVDQRVKGQTYTNPYGVTKTWTGTGWQ